MQINLNILIIEDELLIAEMLKEMLLELGYNVVGIAKNYDMASNALKKSPEVNFAILDINLSEERNGMDVAKLINGEYKIPFIFLTSYSDKRTLQEAIVHKPEAYLVKPFSKIDLFTTLEIIKSRKTNNDKHTIIKEGTLSIKLIHSSILWIKSENVYVEIRTREKTHLLRTSLEKFLEDLNDDCFIRIHRSYAVNENYVKAVNGQYVIVGEEKIPLSRKYRDELMEKFGKII